MQHSKQALSPENANLWAGAAKTGLGLGLLGVLVKILRDGVKAPKDEVDDSDLVLNIRPPQEDKFACLRLVGHNKGAYLTRLLLASGLSTAAVVALDRLHDRIKRRSLKQDIEKLDEAYDLGLSGNLPKTANQGSVSANAAERFKEFVLNSPTEIFLLSLLGGGAATYATLAKTFPERKLKGSDKIKPRRIRIQGFGSLTPDGKADGPLADYQQKAAVTVGSREDHLKAASWLGVALADSALALHSRSPLADFFYDPSLTKQALLEEGANFIFHAPDRSLCWRNLSVREKLEKAAAVFEDALSSPLACSLARSELYAQQPEICLAAQSLSSHPEHLGKMAVTIAAEVSNFDACAG